MSWRPRPRPHWHWHAKQCHWHRPSHYEGPSLSLVASRCVHYCSAARVLSDDSGEHRDAGHVALALHHISRDDDLLHSRADVHLPLSLRPPGRAAPRLIQQVRGQCREGERNEWQTTRMETSTSVRSTRIHRRAHVQHPAADDGGGTVIRTRCRQLHRTSEPQPSTAVPPSKGSPGCSRGGNPGRACAHDRRGGPAGHACAKLLPLTISAPAFAWIAARPSFACSSHYSAHQTQNGR